MAQLEWRESISLDHPDDVDYLYEWATQAQEKIATLEQEWDALKMHHAAALDKVAELQGELDATKSRSVLKREAIQRGEPMPQFPAKPDAKNNP
jgi:predicted  nucleic acid-binding Zn-ribbon protein